MMYGSVEALVDGSIIPDYVYVDDYKLEKIN